MLSECFDLTKYNELNNLVDEAHIEDKELADFLKKANYRFIDFNYSKIADLYNTLEEQELKDIFQEMALIIPDIATAFKYGFVEGKTVAKELAAYEALSIDLK